MSAITGLDGFEIVVQIKTAYGGPILSRNIQRESLNANCFAHSELSNFGTDPQTTRLQKPSLPLSTLIPIPLMYRN